MDQNQLDRFKRWFDDYSNRFLGQDKYVNANLKLKQDHTERVCREIVFLAGELALDDNQTRIAELIALFHDVGRLPQFTQYHTYHDPRSVNHCELGVEVLQTEGILDSLRDEERRWVETAVRYHGIKTLPPDLSGLTLLFCRLIRDADKIDIFRVVLDAYKQYDGDPDNFLLEIELPDDPGYTPEVLDAVLSEQLVDYAKLRTLTDAKLLQLGWVYDLNFTAALKRIDQSGFLSALYALLPETPEIRRACRKVAEHVATRLAQNCQP